MMRIASLIGMLITAVFLSAPAQATPNPSVRALVDGIEGTEGDMQLIVSELRTDIRMHGRMAEITLLARISNPGTDTVEGHFALSLPEDAVVTGYALDVDGTMVDGVLVDQPKARAIYQDEVRKGIDPGLAEVTSNNRFETRIYPIMEGTERTIRIRFVTPIDEKHGLALPLNLSNLRGRLFFNIRAEGYAEPPAIHLPNGKVLVLQRDGDAWQAQIEEQIQGLDGTLKIAGMAAARAMLVSMHRNGRDYFQVADSGERTPQPAAATGLVRIYWDASLSRRNAATANEIALLRAYFDTARPSAIDIVTFTTSKPGVARFTNSPAAIAHLEGITYRGGTSFRGLDSAVPGGADQCLLFSDGMPTIEADAGFRPDCPLRVVASAGSGNGVRLSRIARAGRGELLRLTADNSGEVLKRLLAPLVAVVDARDDSGRRLDFRTLPTAMDKGWLVVGRMPETGAVHLLISGLGRGLTERTYAPAGGAGTARSDAAGALWAATQLEQLADNPAARDEMRALAISHQVASPTMAFLVLERPDQYVAAGIEPPLGFPKQWMTDYALARRQAKIDKSNERDERLTFVIAQWTARKSWWATRFDARPRKPSAKQDDSRQTRASEPVPPAHANIAREDAASTESIVVTGARVEPRGPSVSRASDTPAEPAHHGPTIELDIENVLADQPYLKALATAAPDERFNVLAAQEKIYGTLPAFYLETSEWFRLAGDTETATMLLLSALEVPAADDETRLVVAFRLSRAKRHDAAIGLLDAMAASSEFRPQPKRSLALALAERGRSRGRAGRDDLERAFALLTAVALEPADNDFNGIETIALMEANALIPAIEAAGGTWALDPRLVAKLDTDVRIVIEWSNDDADIDLHIVEPGGETVYYSNTVSGSGGTISNDMTEGYGPEEYVVRRAPAGRYQVRIDGYSSDRLNPNGKGRVMVRLIRDFARPGMTEDLVDAEISFEPDDGDNDGQTGRPIAAMTVSRP